MINLRILQLHSDFIEYELVEKEIDIVEEFERKIQRYDDVLVLFTSVEEGDDERIAKEAVEEVKRSLDALKVKKILIYPYAHLSNRLAKPSEALAILRAMEAFAKELGIEAYRAPFGWCKRFSISLKGHPLAEQFKVVLPKAVEKVEEWVPEALKAEEKLVSHWYILTLDGEMIPIDLFDFSRHPMLEKFAKYEIAKVRAVQQVPPHVILMKKLKIADYEPGSDLGNMRWYPKGRLIKSLLEEYVSKRMIEYGAMEVETPIMYDFKHPALMRYLDRFPARQYSLKSDDKDLFLRFSACFGQFLMAHDVQISYRHLPLKLYELTRYSFRREKSGELVGLRRLRAFTMPDCHALCVDLDQAKQEALIRFKLCMDVLEDGLELTRDDYELAIRFTNDFYVQNASFILDLVKAFGKPVLIEMWDRRFFYFALKWEFNFVDNLDKASALSTDQIDVESAERYEIMYVDGEGKKKYPLILHCSPSGAIERCVYALLEKAHRERAIGRQSTLPLWLSPTQVRLIPVSDEFLTDVEKIADELERSDIRVDVDDRPLTVPRKVRDAEVEWIPYVVVLGRKEVESGVLPVRDRIAKLIKSMKLDELIDEVKRRTRDKPFKKLPLPRLLSKRAQL